MTARGLKAPPGWAVLAGAHAPILVPVATVRALEPREDAGGADGIEDAAVFADRVALVGAGVCGDPGCIETVARLRDGQHAALAQASASRSAQLVALLKARPGRPIAELTEAIYGASTTENRSRTRALLAQLGRLGRLRNISAGRWEVVDPDRRAS